MKKKLKLFLLQSFMESKKRVKDIEHDSPIISYEDANTTFQNPILMDARTYELNKKIEEHKLWLAGKGGNRLILHNADLRNADLGNADLDLKEQCRLA